MPIPASSTENRITAERVVLPIEARPDDHLSRGCKLHCISAEIEQNLAQSSGITAQPHGHVRIDPAYQLQTFFLSLDPQQLPGALQYGRQGEIQNLQVQFARFDFGEVENIVDHRKQGFAGGADSLRVLLLFGA